MPSLEQTQEQVLEQGQPSIESQLPTKGNNDSLLQFQSDLTDLFSKTQRLGEQISESIENNNRLNIDIDQARKKSEFVFNLTLLGFFIVLIMFGAMLIDAWKSQGVSYQQLLNQINNTQGGFRNASWHDRHQ